MNNPEQINSDPADVAAVDEMGRQPADELMDINNMELEQVDRKSVV